MFTEAWQVGRSTEEQVRIVAKVLDREDEVDTSDKLGREPSARPTLGHAMGQGPLAGGSVKSFSSNISTRGTKTTHNVAGSRMSKNDARSSNTPFANSKPNSNKAGSAVLSHTDNTPFAFSKPNSNKAGSVVSSNKGNTPFANSIKAGSVVSSNTGNTPFANSIKAGSVDSSNTGNTPFANSKQSSSATKPDPKKTQ